MSFLQELRHNITPIAVAIGLLFARAIAAADFQIEAGVDTTSEFRITFPSTNSAYFEVWTSEELSGPWSLTRGMTLGEDGTQTWTDAGAVGSFTQLFYRLLCVPRSDPHDSDRDGIHDVYELEHAGALDPLDPSDAMLDADDDTFANLYEFKQGSDPANAASVPAATLFADASAAAGGTGSAASPFNTIQAALNAATNYDIVQLADGVYTGAGNRALSYQGKAVMLVSTGGAAACILDGGGESRAFCFAGGEGAAAVVRGLTVRNGRADLGGAIYCSNASPSIQHCVLSDNRATLRGGGVYCEDARPVLEGCTIMGNSGASNGGGVAAVRSSGILRNSILEGNLAGPGVVGACGNRARRRSSRTA